MGLRVIICINPYGKRFASMEQPTRYVVSWNVIYTLNDSSYAKNLIYQLTQEIVHVATTDDVYLNVDEVFEYLINLNEKVGPHYPSMYQDLIKDHRKTEIDYINGAVAQLGKENNIPAPVNAFVTNLIHSKENQLNAQ